MDIIAELDAAEVARIGAIRTFPSFSAGDTLRVNVRVTEGTRTRVQAYEGVCIARSGGGLHENFTVRKISYGGRQAGCQGSQGRGGNGSRIRTIAFAPLA